ncbi:MAG: hypothetical protein JW847_07400 [Candidatus Omnitrophica bacterium]|nr:hypothetical protein [Candidatus Omnitrophota bacterium]
MNQKFYHKASVQVAIVTAIGLIIMTLVTIWHQRSQLKQDNKMLEREIVDKSAEIQRLETLLMPFRTIALEKYTGDEKEALQKLADYVVELQKKDAEQTKQIGELQSEVDQTKKLYGPPILVPLGKQIKQTSLGYEAIVQFRPSNNSRVDGYIFNARVIEGDLTIVSFGGSVDHHAMVGGVGEVSDDKKSAKVFFNPLAGNPTIKIVVTTSGIIELKGSHLDRAWQLEI